MNFGCDISFCILEKYLFPLSKQEVLKSRAVRAITATELPLRFGNI